MGNDYEPLRDYIHKVGEDVNEIISRQVADEEFANIHDLLTFQWTSGGKRLRPTIATLVSQSLGGDYHETIEVATALELMHSSSLNFDDVLDFDILRRGKPATHVVFGVGSAIMGGILYSTLALKIVSRGIELTNVLRETMEKLAIGNAEEMMNRSYDVNRYQRIIGLKTASLISAASKVGALMARDRNIKMKKQMVGAAEHFGYNLGMVYQVSDDLVAVLQSLKHKEPEEDLEDSVITLPLIHLYHTTQNSDVKNIMIKYISKVPLTEEEFHILLDDIQTTGSIDYTNSVIECYKQEVLKTAEAFPDNEYTAMLKLLPDYVYDVFMAEV